MLNLLCYRDSLSPSRKWPTVSEIKDFRDKVREIVDDLIDHKLNLRDGDEIN